MIIFCLLLDKAGGTLGGRNSQELKPYHRIESTHVIPTIAKEIQPLFGGFFNGSASSFFFKNNLIVYLTYLHYNNINYVSTLIAPPLVNMLNYRRANFLCTTFTNWANAVTAPIYKWKVLIKLIFISPNLAELTKSLF